MRYGLNGLISAMNNTQIDEHNAARLAEEAGRADGSDPYAHLITRLHGYMASCWEAARDAKAPIETVMLEDMRQREGVYDPDKLAAIRQQGGSEVYMQLTNLKCRALVSWLYDVLFPAGERPFYAGPSPEPDLGPEQVQQIVQIVIGEAQQAMSSGLLVTPREVYQRARDQADQMRQQFRDEADLRASRMEDAIDDVLVEGDWYEAMEDFLPDFVSMPFGVLKGPVIRNRRRLEWAEKEGAGWEPQPVDELIPVWYSPSPFDIYPAPNSSGPEDGYIFEVIPLRHGALHGMIGVPGWNEEAIRAVLDEYSAGHRVRESTQSERKALENKRNWEREPDQGLDMLEFHGQVKGSMLVEWGMDGGEVEDPDEFYEVTAAMIGRHVVRCVLNEDPMRRRPYLVASFDKIKGQFVGKSLPRCIRDIAEICNATARALVNNLAIASGPLGEVEADRLAEGEDATQIWPWRLIQTQSNRSGTPGPAVRWHNVSSHAQELLQVYQHFSQLADTYSGVQSFDHGVSSRSGSAATASGLSMLMNASSRQVKGLVRAIDRVITGTIDRVHTHLMLYSDDDDIKGDVQFEARGASQLMVREQQQLRRAEFLQLTSNPIDMDIIGPDGRAELLRETIKTLDMPADRVVPARDEIIARMRQPPPAPQGGPDGPELPQPGPVEVPGDGGPPRVHPGNVPQF